MQQQATAPPFASIVRRLEAGATTCVPAAVLWFMALWIGGSLLPVEETLRGRGLSVKAADLIVAIAAALLPIAWITVEGGVLRATYGMRKRGLCFTGLTGEPIGRLRCLLRTLAGIVLLPLAPVSLILMLFDDRARGLADRVCGTTVSVVARRSAWPGGSRSA